MVLPAGGVINIPPQNQGLLNMDAAPGMGVGVQPGRNMVRQNEFGLSADQLMQLRAQEANQNQLLAMTQALMAGLGNKTVQNQNPRFNNGYAPRVRPVDQRGKLGIEHPSSQLLSGQQLLRRLFQMQSVMGEKENNLTDMMSQMTWEQRRDYLKMFDLKRYSLYDPLPDSTAVYQVNLLVARNLTERMYEF